ncbi:hypothetical protein M378DRAFT_161291 [Amanita muscaria Koide BX008]|uniref:Uncharacterized protein n=1 Tax=Amanita muscaria (strain Koide BX008) TaxID=946122 RepID=A0A0C2X9T4_AMAMK|nr:hypothetical protein M378DRAFT_161291 [Amanita muscaria Koide BX008]
MPTIISSSASSVTSVPPPAALQQSLRILKRPSPSSASPTPGQSTPDASADLKQREARYQAARDRIFGADSPTQTASNSTQSATRVVREPRGPDEGQDRRGFVQRRRDDKPIPSSSSSAQSGKQ